MIALTDGRKELYQWDTNVSVTVPKDCTQVHFSNSVYGRSFDVNVIGGVAIIPDVLLQTDKDLNAWAFVGKAENGYTKISKVFNVNKRNKPADYVFTPVEQVTIAEIAAIAQSVRDDADAGMFDGEVPDALPNPNKLIFTGAVTAEYDGSKTVTVSVPAGGGGSGAGTDGKSAYDIWLEQGNTGTEEDFLNSLKGYTPQKGVDYFTDADKEEIIAEVLASGGGTSGGEYTLLSEFEVGTSLDRRAEIRLNTFDCNEFFLIAEVPIVAGTNFSVASFLGNGLSVTTKNYNQYVYAHLVKINDMYMGFATSNTGYDTSKNIFSLSPSPRTPEDDHDLLTVSFYPYIVNYDIVATCKLYGR